jgi:predicted SpoU family rRNA methylase
MFQVDCRVRFARRLKATSLANGFHRVPGKSYNVSDLRVAVTGDPQSPDFTPFVFCHRILPKTQKGASRKTLPSVDMLLFLTLCRRSTAPPYR